MKTRVFNVNGTGHHQGTLMSAITAKINETCAMLEGEHNGTINDIRYIDNVVDAKFSVSAMIHYSLPEGSGPKDSLDTMLNDHLNRL